MANKLGSLRFSLMVGIGGIALILTLVASLLLGAHAVPIHIFRQLFEGQCPPSSLDCLIVLGSRIPRTLAGILVGAALGLAGVLMQTLTRNPLAEPGILGVNAGAGFAVIVGISFLHVHDPTGYIICAFIGALLTTILVVWCANALRRFDPLKLLLSGVAFGAMLDGVGSGLALLNPEVYDQLRFWQAGSFDIQSLSILHATIWPIGFGVALSLCLLRSLNAIAMGRDVALNLGIMSHGCSCFVF
jgi:iron complex transport system permease protein